MKTRETRHMGMARMEDSTATAAAETVDAAVIRQQSASTETPGTLFPVGKVIWWDELTGSPDKDTPSDPPATGGRGDHHVCQYTGSIYSDEDDFLTWRTNPEWFEPDCAEEAEYYITAINLRDPIQPTVDRYYYCVRHFAENIGYLCESLAAATPEDERAELASTGEIPNRMALLSWGRLSDLDKETDKEDGD